MRSWAGEAPPTLTGEHREFSQLPGDWVVLEIELSVDNKDVLTIVPEGVTGMWG